MSQNRQKKQLATLDSVNQLTDQELREALKGYNEKPGPITDSTRNLYRKKLASIMDRDTGLSTSPSDNHVKEDKTIPLSEIYKEFDHDSTSDDDYNAQDEEETEDSDEEEEDEDEEESSDGSDEELDDDVKLSSTLSENDPLTTSVIAGADSTPNRVSRMILIVLGSFFVALISFYLYFRTNNSELFTFSPPLKNLTQKLLVLLALSPIGYIAYRTVRFYKLRRSEESQRVCDLVNHALELLNSPDNPTGMMPILHVRDTLLTPAERKTKKMINLWNKASRFIEEHESRIKVELVNIDGEDFRAWKWIGSRKL